MHTKQSSFLIAALVSVLLLVMAACGAPDAPTGTSAGAEAPASHGRR